MWGGGLGRGRGVRDSCLGDWGGGWGEGLVSEKVCGVE